MERAISFDSQVDVYLDDDSRPSTPVSDRPSRRRSAQLRSEAEAFLRTHAASPSSSAAITRDKSRLERFHTEAMSFLSKAYANDEAVLIDDTSAPSPVALDQERLQRFHDHALSFLRRAYADDPAAPDGDADIPSSHALQRFHSEALNIASASTANLDPRVERDKSRLEQYYQDALSFLHRADDRPHVEEQPLESVALDRIQLQRYAREAMSFLDKAFSGDASVLVEDDQPEPYSPRAAARAEEERQIAADRAALQKYEKEFDHFLSIAYESDADGHVEDAEISSGNEGGLFARRVVASTTSNDTSYTPSISQDESEDAFTDEEFQAEPASHSSHMHVLRGQLPTPTRQSNDMLSDDQHESVRSKMARYEREAANYIDGANVSEEEVDGEKPFKNAPEARRAQNRSGRSKSRQRKSAPNAVPELNRRVQRRDVRSRDDDTTEDEQAYDDKRKQQRLVNKRQLQTHPSDATDNSITSDENAELVPDLQIDNEQAMVSTRERHSVASSKSAPAARASPGKQLPRANEGLLKSSANKDLLVNLMLEDTSGQSHEWSEVPLETSFYRQLPRGSTIKLRPRVSPQQNSLLGAPSLRTSDSSSKVSAKELERVERERDALMAALEEIINERSMLAAQVSEMKAMIHSAGGGEHGNKSEVYEEDDIDLAAELRDAHATMARLTEEMEATLAVLENRYQETLHRAHKAEERCIRLETSSSQLQVEFSKQDKKLSQVQAQKQTAVAALAKTEKELEALRIKSEDDVEKMQDTLRGDTEKLNRTIQDLTSEVAVLQEKLRSSTAENSNKRNVSSFQKSELQVSVLQRRIAQGEKELAEERIRSKEHAEAERKRVEVEKNREIQDLNAQLKKLELESKDSEIARLEANRNASDLTRLRAQQEETEQVMAKMQTELVETRRAKLAAEAEVRVSRRQYEEALKQQISALNESGELLELRATLHGLTESASTREKNLEVQLAEFRRRAEQAEGAAANAERNAQDAAEAAKLTQDRSKQAVDMERKARLAAEAELKESKDQMAQEKLAQEKLEAKAKAEAQSTEIVKTSSRRGLRKSSSRNAARDNAKKKKEHSKLASGSTDEAPRKKPYHRSRLFG